MNSELAFRFKEAFGLEVFDFWVPVLPVLFATIATFATDLTEELMGGEDAEAGIAVVFADSPQLVKSNKVTIAIAEIIVVLVSKTTNPFVNTIL